MVLNPSWPNRIYDGSEFNLLMPSVLSSWSQMCLSLNILKHCNGLCLYSSKTS
uniref:Uncharacterized protein n=1 Tax=Arundo donax TaxID=35708 RepID=A0A0A9ENI2_ARUDO